MPADFSAADLLEVVENQLTDGEPIVVKETLLRLTMTGHSKEDALAFIASALSLEFTAIAEQGGAFDLARYSANLALLPDAPWLVSAEE